MVARRGLKRPQVVVDVESDRLHEELADLERRMKQRDIHNLIESKYKFAISYDKNRNQYYTRDLNNPKNKIRAVTREGLEKKLYDKFFGGEKDTTIDALFWEYLDWKSGIVSSETIARERNYYKKFVGNTDFAKQDIRKLKHSDVKKFLWQYSEKVTRKELGGMKTALIGTYAYAIDNDIVSENIAEQVSTKGIKCIVRRSYNNVYTMEDRKKLLTALYDSTNIYDLAIEALFYTGVRSGEIRALKWSDICNGMLTVQREIVTRNNKYVVVEHTKTGDDSGARDLPIHPKLAEIFAKIPRKDGVEFIFTGKNDNPIYEQPLRERMQKACESANVTYRAIHKTRACTTSMLIVGGADLNTVMNYGGWKDKQTVMGYFRNVQNSDNLKKKILEVF